MNQKPIVLHCAIHSGNYSSEGITRGFKENGYDVIQLNWQEWRFSHGIESLRRELIRLAQNNNPELIFLHIQNDGVLDIETIKSLSSVGLTINYTFDVRSKEKTQWLYSLAPYTGLTLFACKEDVEHCAAIGIRNTGFICSSCDMELYKPLLLPEKIKKQYPEIIFIGNNFDNTNLGFEGSRERKEMVQFLHDEFTGRFQHYGMNWAQSQIINPQQEITMYNSCKIAITQNNFKRYGYTSDRLFRIMSCGAFCLSQYYEGMEQTLQKEIHLDWWRNFNDLKVLINFYLQEDEERRAIANIGSKFVRENETWGNRVYQLKKMIQQHEQKSNS
jgi:hypothetical protein